MSTIKQGLALHRQGRQREAEAIYRSILAREPRQFTALQFLGLIRFQAGDLQEAHQLITRALELRPGSVEALSILVAVLLPLGRPAEALVACDKLLAINRRDPQTLYNRGVVLLRLARFEEALVMCDAALAQQASFVPALFDRANALAQLDRLEEAAASYDKALALAPGNLDGVNNRGNVYAKLGNYTEALACYDKVLGARPGHLEALTGRGVALNNLERDEEAVACYRRALAINPASFDALFNLGNVLLKLNRVAEALRSYAEALTQKPADAGAALGCASVLSRLGRTEEALALLEPALAAHAGHSGLLATQADLFTKRRQFDLAARGYRDILAIEPDHEIALSGLANCLLETCDWGRADDPAGRLPALVAADRRVDPLVYMRMVDDAASHLACARNFIKGAVPVAAAALAPSMRARSGQLRSGRLRIAYCSPDYCLHPVAFLIPQLLELHDRTRFEVIGVSYGPDDGSAIRSRLVSSFDEFHDATFMSVKGTAQLLNDLNVDILVDLCGYTEHCRPAVLAYRPAPVQVSYLGYCGTMGAPFIDYIIADRFALPRDQQPFFNERIVHLPDSFLVNDSTQEVSRQLPSRAEAGLPEGAFVFCCFNKNYKIAPMILDVWMRLLRQVDGSVLWLTRGNEWATQNLRREAERRGVDAARLVFSPTVPRREDHFARQRLADLFLDTLPYNAHTTACDALYVGLPVVTSAGKAFAGRVATSLVHAAGLPELATGSLDEYEALALKLATEPDRLSAMRRKLAESLPTCALFDADRFRRHLEKAYATMWEICQRGEPPRGFDVEPEPREG